MAKSYFGQRDLSVDKELSHLLGVTNVHHDIQKTMFMQESNEINLTQTHTLHSLGI